MQQINHFLRFASDVVRVVAMIASVEWTTLWEASLRGGICKY